MDKYHLYIESMNVEILVSCMYENGIQLLERLNIEKDVVVINQCDATNEEIKLYPGNVKIIDTPTRGLSVSRNLAIKNSTADICMLSDDDEVFVDNAHQIIAESYKTYSNADVIIFKIENVNKLIINKPKKLNYFELLKVGSWMISFKREAIIRNNIEFDTLMGSGTGNGGGEENKFLIECYKKNLQIYYVPVVVASLNPSDSKWFKGFDKDYFYTRGASTRYLLGLPLSVVYAVYYILKKRNKYINTISSRNAMSWILKGIVDNKIGKQKNDKD